MARVHSRQTVIIIDGNDISQYCTDSTCEQSAGTEDNTTYGKNAEVHDPTMLTGEFSCGGKYDSDAGGPRRVLKVRVGQKVNIKYRPEGTGSGLPQDSFDAVITKYSHGSVVAGYATWVFSAKPSDEWDSTDQS